MNVLTSIIRLRKIILAIVGNRLYTDIAVADNNDVLSILVLSGETKKEDVPESKHQPDIMIKNIGELAKLL